MDEIIKYAESLSDVCGVADLEIDRDRLVSTYGEDILKLPYAIVIAHRLKEDEIEKIPLSFKNPKLAGEYLQEYQNSFERVAKSSVKIVDFIKKQGYEAILIDKTGTNEKLNLKRNFSNKASASIAGLGWIGKNAMLINKDFGPRLTWNTILTDAPIGEHAGRPMESLCGQCRECIDSCPSGAIIDDLNPELSYSPQRCAEFLKGMWEKNHVMACGMCLYICPYGRK